MEKRAKKRSVNCCNAKRLLFVSLMLLMTHIGFANSAIINIVPPTPHHEYVLGMYYCVEYKEVNSDEWICIEISPEITDGILQNTLCYIDGLMSGTQYVVRVHAYFVEYDFGLGIIDDYWGAYGPEVTFMTLIDGGSVVGIDVQCGLFHQGGQSHDYLEVPSQDMYLQKQILFKEEE